MLRISSGRRGISIAVALLVLVVVSVIGLAVAAIGTQNLSLANADRNMQRARYAAEAGIAAAQAALLNNTALDGGLPVATLQTNTDCKYSVTIRNNFAGTTNLAASDGTVVPRGMAYLLSTGTVGNIGNAATQRIGCLLVLGGGPLFKYAAFGVNGVSLGGTSAVEDSFSSSATGGYTASQQNSHADVGTNATAPDSVSYSGHAVNYGNVFVGPGGTSSAVDGTSPTNFTGTVQPLAVPFTVPMPDPNMLPGTTDVSYGTHVTTTLAPGAYRNMTTGSQCDISLQPGGTYYFSGDVKLGAGSNLIIPSTTGLNPVKIYVDGSWDSGGGSIVNESANTSNFQLYGTASCTSVTINGGNDAYMVVDAPNANVIVQGNSAIFGAVIGNTVNVQGSAAIHFDRDLLNNPVTRPALFPRAWKRAML